MKLNQEVFEDTVIGAEKEMSFTIDQDNPIIFEILRNKMYTDKIGAICREVSSNSRDANREAGNGDRPVQIQIYDPSTHDDSSDLLSSGIVSHTSIGFRDFGIGITPDRIEKIFIKYGASTKRDSNAQTGGFGLGAKTPFAYTDTFTVVTTADWEEPIIVKQTKRVPVDFADDGTVLEYADQQVDVIIGHKEMRRQMFTYTAMIDNTRKGKMILFDSEDAPDRETGTEIIVPINTIEDKSEFEKKCRFYTQYWGNGIEYIGFDKENTLSDVIHEEESFLLAETESNDRYAMLIDGIPYPLNTNYFSFNTSGLGRGTVIVLKFDVGETTISANRESVQYDTTTKDNIEKKYQAIAKELSVYIKSELSQFDTFIGACIIKNALSVDSHKIQGIKDRNTRMWAYALSEGVYRSDRGICHSLRKDVLESIVYEGKEVQDKFNFKHHNYCVVSRGNYVREKTVYDMKSRFQVNSRMVQLRKFYGDKRRNGRRNETIWDQQVQKELTAEFMLIVPKPSSSLLDQMNEMCDFALYMEMDIELYGDIEMKEISKVGVGGSAYVKRPTIEVKVRKFGSKYQDNNVSAILKVDRDSGKTVSDKDIFLYVVDSIRTVDNDLSAYSRLYQQMKFLTDLTEKEIFIVNTKSYDKYFKDLTNVDLFEDIWTKIEKSFHKKWQIENRKAAILRYTRYDSNVPKWFIEEYAEYLPKCARNLELDKKYDYQMLMGRTKILFDKEGYIKKCNELMKKIPLINNMSYSYASESEKKHLKEYIETFAK